MSVVESRRQFYPALDAATEAALRASIERFGVLVPPVVDQHGEIIDGHHRVRIAAELGIEHPVSTRQVASEDEARELARTLNEDRRMLSREQRLPVVAALREGGHSIRAIAGALGVSKGAIQKDVESGRVPRGTPDAATTGLDGKTYPAAKPRPERKKMALPSTGAKRDQWSNGAKERIERAVGTCNGIARGFDELKVEWALPNTTDAEMAGWLSAFREARSAISRLESRIKEARRES